MEALERAVQDCPLLHHDFALRLTKQWCRGSTTPYKQWHWPRPLLQIRLMLVLRNKRRSMMVAYVAVITIARGQNDVRVLSTKSFGTTRI